VPGAHDAGATHTAAFFAVVPRPASHASQTRSSLEVGVLAMCVPGTQSVQSSHFAEFCVVEKLPDAQPEHV
jgi:hypothetical protein